MPAPGARAAARALGQSRYFTGLPCKKGHITERLVSNSNCVACLSQTTDAWRSENREHVNELDRARYAANPDVSRAKSKASSGTPAKSASWKKWAAENRPYLRERDRAHAAGLSQRTPAWSDREACRQVYESCPEGYEIDHEIPLFGKLVSGLHVPNNLRPLPIAVNRAKGNTFDPTTFIP